MPVFQDAGEIGMAGAWQGDRLRPLPVRLALGLPGAHAPGPVLVVEVADDERQRGAERVGMPEAREHLDGVGLELLPRAPAVSELAAPQVGVDRLSVEPQPGGEPGEDGHERGTVRFSCGDEAERHAPILDAREERPAEVGRALTHRPVGLVVGAIPSPHATFGRSVRVAMGGAGRGRRARAPDRDRRALRLPP